MKAGDDTDTGARLYARYLDGDDDAFVKIVRLYRKPLMAFALGFEYDIASAEDIVADAFFALAAKKARYRGKSSFKTWLFAITRNAALGYIRKHRRSIPTQDAGNTLVEQAAGPEDALLKDEQKRELHRALARIGGQYQQVLHLRYLEDMDNGEIATIMHKSKLQVENLMYRAKAKLREEMDSEQDDSERGRP